MKKVDIIRMDDNEYLLVSETTYDNEKFGYLINVLDNNEILFIHFNEDETISVVKDDELIKKLIPFFIANQDYI